MIKPIPNSKIKINNGAEYFTDENGKFIFNKIDLYSPATLSFSADKYSPQAQYIQNYNPNLNVYLYNGNYYQNYYSYKSQPAVPSSSAQRDDLIPMAQEGIALSAVDMAELADAPKKEKHFEFKNKPAAVNSKAINANAVVANNQTTSMLTHTSVSMQKLPNCLFNFWMLI